MQTITITHHATSIMQYPCIVACSKQQDNTLEYTFFDGWAYKHLHYGDTITQHDDGTWTAECKVSTDSAD